jgi:hypothetical protein
MKQSSMTNKHGLVFIMNYCYCQPWLSKNIHKLREKGKKEEVKKLYTTINTECHRPFLGVFSFEKMHTLSLTTMHDPTSSEGEYLPS